MEKAQSTSGYTSIHVKYARKIHNFDSGEYLTVEWYDGSDWNNIEQAPNEDTWVLKDWTLPSGAANNSSFKIRFSTNADKNTEFAHVDNVEITGTQ